MRRRIDDLECWADAGWTDAEGRAEPGTAYVLREVLPEDYAGADDEAYDDALEAVLDGMSAAEAFSFAKALRQMQPAAGRVLSDPLVGQVPRTGLPVGAGALGTLIGGPAGTAIGSRFGTLAAGALAPPGRPAKATGGGPPMSGGTPADPSGPAAGPPAALGALPAAGPASPAVAGGSAAAAQALVLSQQPDMLKALLAPSMGQHGARQVGGVPVASVMSLLSSVSVKRRPTRTSWPTSTAKASKPVSSGKAMASTPNPLSVPAAPSTRRSWTPRTRSWRHDDLPGCHRSLVLRALPDPMGFAERAVGELAERLATVPPGDGPPVVVPGYESTAQEALVDRNLRLGPVEALGAADDTTALVSAYGPEVSEWARAVTVESPERMRIILTPIPGFRS